MARKQATDSGPTKPAKPTAGSFALLSEVLLTGVYVTALALPVLTLPAALVAGVRHLRRYVKDEGSPTSAIWRDFRDALVGGVGVAVAALAGVAAATMVIGLAALDATVVGSAMSVVGYLALGIVGTAILLAAGSWTPDGGWLRAVRGLRDRLDLDPAAALYLLVAVALAAVLTWQFLLLLVPSLGVVAFAVVAVQSRNRERVAQRS